MGITTEYLSPLVYNRFTVHGSGVEFSASCFQGKDWSLGPLQKPEDVEKHPTLAAKVNAAVGGLGGRRAYAPNPTKFNAQIITPSRLNHLLRLGDVDLYRNQDRPADGTFLVAKGDAGIFSAGGCGVLVVAYKNYLIFAHAGRECVLDRTRVETLGKNMAREYNSVVNYVFAMLGVPDHELNQVYAWPLYSIHPEEFAHHFNDKKYGAYNRAAAQYIPKFYGEECAIIDHDAVCIDLPQLMKTQLIMEGVPPQNIFLDHAYLSDELPHTRNGGGRYLVAVVRHS
jgi:hypothetical protein